MVAVLVLALACAALARTASLRQSATFDEIILVSGGVRGVTHGEWGMVTDQPPLTMWLYGWAAASPELALPSEDRAWSFDDRWDYARALFFGPGSEPQRLLGRARLVASLVAGATVLTAGALAAWVAGPTAGVLAAASTAFMPDVLAHGGVAYNDLPLALAFLLAVWALDAAVRRPTPGRGALVGLAIAAAFGMKLSALALLPVAVLLVAAEAWVRRMALPWRRDLLVAAAAAGLGGYVALVLMYSGDPTLTLLRFNFWRTVIHASGGHEAPAFLLGAVSDGGWWYYFPVAFLFKTPVAFQAALGLGVVALGRAWWALPDGTDRPWSARVQALLTWRGRGALLGVLVFGAFLLRSDLNAGFRYALPILPLLAVLAASGLARGPRDAGPSPSPGGWFTRTRLAGAALALVVVQAVSVLSVHPHHLAFSSVWAGGRDRAWRVLSDSNVDWGQGLLELRRFMDDEGVPSVSLSYFGSARPEAYGIEYVALPGFFRLDQPRTPGAEARPRFTVISSTNLNGLYLQGRDPFAPYREREPYRVLGHALFVYDDGG